LGAKFGVTSSDLDESVDIFADRYNIKGGGVAELEVGLQIPKASLHWQMARG